MFCQRQGGVRAGVVREYGLQVFLSLINKTPGTLHGNTGHLAPGNIGIIRIKHGINPHPAITYANGNI